MLSQFMQCFFIFYFYLVCKICYSSYFSYRKNITICNPKDLIENIDEFLLATDTVFII